MRLLVSVRSAREVEAAIAGGADIIDAKEPARGSLGAVDEVTLGAIAEAVPEATALSVALGELGRPGQVMWALGGIDGMRERRGELYVKAGLAGIGDIERARRALEAISETARASRPQPELVLVAYADYGRAESLAPEDVMTLADGAGCRGVLLDTWIKDGRDLFEWIHPLDLGSWLDRSRQRGLLTAVAGSLAATSFCVAAGLGPDIVGVRGAACDGGRGGAVSEARVRELATALSQIRPRPEAAA